MYTRKLSSNFSTIFQKNNRQNISKTPGMFFGILISFDQEHQKYFVNAIFVTYYTRRENTFVSCYFNAYQHDLLLTKLICNAKNAFSQDIRLHFQGTYQHNLIRYATTISPHSK